MRPLTLGIVLAAVLATGCSRPVEERAPVAPPSQTMPPPVVLDRISRVAAHLPPGYEQGRADDLSSPVGSWGFRTGWVADPPQCAALVGSGDPRGHSNGISGSGPGGTLYVVASRSPVDPGLVGQCGQWTVAGGHSWAQVDSVAGPDIEGTQTASVTARIRTSVESGSQTDTAASTDLARVGDVSVFVTLITDPGSPDPPLDRAYAAQLLATTVAVLRGG